MRVIKEWNVKIKLVRTKRGAILHMIELKPGTFSWNKTHLNLLNMEKLTGK